MTTVSIVTGTYNRLRALTTMIKSVRNSVGMGLPYEVVVVDGGSTDGTIAWAIAQPDVVLITHGELRGAVKAFNDGARAARGKYVILANDDVEFVGWSIPRAVAYMDDNLDQVGIGCFYQDRDGKDWHIDYMPMEYERKMIHVPYGQVCIVPKQLGDHVGWWGDYLHTYGGDNELSCNVWELGYNVVPIACACVHDTKVDDGLRDRNMEYQHSPGISDSKLWTNKWFGKHRRGPRFGSITPPDFTYSRKQRVVYAPLYEPGNKLQAETKKGLREALAKQFLLIEADYMSDGYEGLEHAMEIFTPDILITQFQDISIIGYEHMKILRKKYNKTKFVNWNGDYHPENFLHPEYIRMMSLYDLAGMVTTMVKDVYTKHKVHWAYWQIGYETAETYQKRVPSYDVVYLANGYLSFRHTLVGKLRQRFGNKFGLYGSSWPSGWSKGTNLYDFSYGEALYSNSLMAISTQEYPEGTGFVSNRLFQALAAGGGCMVLQQKFEGMEECLGLVDGKHLVVWETVDDLIDKIAYYRMHQGLRMEIALAGTAFVREYHSFDTRVREMTRWLGLKM